MILMLLKPNKVENVKFWQFLAISIYVNPNQSRNWMKKSKTWPKYQENWVKTHNYKHKLTLIMVRALTCDPPLSCSNWVKVLVSQLLVMGHCSNDQEKITKSLPTFSWTLESSNQRCDFSWKGQIWCQVWWFWSQMRSRQDHFDNFWSFRHRKTKASKEIWNLVENEAVRRWFHILIQRKWGYG